jgi:predicted small secreted protein
MIQLQGKTMIRLLSAAALLASIAACNTVEGVGRDVSAGGQVITGTAQEVSREIPPVPKPAYTY